MAKFRPLKKLKKWFSRDKVPSRKPPRQTFLGKMKKDLDPRTLLNLLPGKKNYRLRRDGLDFNVRRFTSDRYVIDETLRHRDYGNLVREGDTIIDLGANIGSFSADASRKAKKVVAYEPDKSNYKQLEKNLQLNNIGNVETHREAVSNSTGKRTFYTSAINKGTSSFYKRKWLLTAYEHLFGNKEDKVDCTTLDRIVHKAGDVDLLKMDVEGAEYDILLNTGKETLGHIKRIVMEYHPTAGDGHGPEELSKYLEDNGFAVDINQSKPYKAIFGKKEGVLYAEKE